MALVDRVAQLRIDKKYYRIRTDYGSNYDAFYNNGFVAIGHDYINKQRLFHDNQDLTRTLISQRTEYNLDTVSGSREISKIFNTLHTFKNLKRGDVVFIPSQDSNRIAFGEIADDEIYQVPTGTQNCDYIKRRRVNWFDEFEWQNLDPKMHEISSRGNVISDYTHLASYIDKIMRNLFIKNNLSHLVIDVRTNEPIQLIELLNLLTNIKDLSIAISERYNLDNDVNDLYIKLNLQSPGITEFIKSGTSLIFIAAMLSLSSCENPEDAHLGEDTQEVLDLNNDFSEQLNSINNSLDSLSVPEHMRNYF